ncbi:hypothetical protein Taro_004502, partial [Colocasia esculenta]|nr:hypothetical protein [Colocasia esculenta]
MVVSALRVLSGCLVQAPNCWLCNPFLGAILGGTGVCSSLTSWRVQGLGWFCLGALNLVEVRAEGYFRMFFDSAGSAGVVSGPTLVVCHGVTLFRCFVVLYSRDSLSQEFVAGWLWWQFVAPCIASSVSCERERLFRSELRVAFLQVLGLFEFISYLTGLNSNPSGSSDPWVAARPSGSLAGVWEVGCLAFQQGLSVSCRRVLLLLLGARAASVVAVFAQAAVGFVLGLRIRVGVSRRLREP